MPSSPRPAPTAVSGVCSSCDRRQKIVLDALGALGALARRLRRGVLGEQAPLAGPQRILDAAPLHDLGLRHGMRAAQALHQRDEEQRGRGENRLGHDVYRGRDG